MRKAHVKRETKETAIDLSLNLDGQGRAQCKTGIGFLDHMLTLFAGHGLFDLTLKAKGDTEVDLHHTVEDVGIVLGDAIKQALGKKFGINRYGFAAVPMDDALSTCSLDISGRPTLVYKVKFSKKKIGDFETELIKEFFQGLVNHAGITLHLNLLYGDNSHHCAESLFKSFACALDEATGIDLRRRGLPSTKGKL